MAGLFNTLSFKVLLRTTKFGVIPGLMKLCMLLESNKFFAYPWICMVCGPIVLDKA